MSKKTILQYNYFLESFLLLFDIFIEMALLIPCRLMLEKDPAFLIADLDGSGFSGATDGEPDDMVDVGVHSDGNGLLSSVSNNFLGRGGDRKDVISPTG